MTMVLVSAATVVVYRRRARAAGRLPSAAAIAIIVGAAAALLLAMGRAPTYRHGALRVYAGDVHGDENSQQLTDPYTLTHVTHGIALYAVLRLLAPRAFVGLRAVVAVAIESTWEVLENTDAVIERYRAATMAQGYYGDTVVNSVGDVAAMVAGFTLAAMLSAPVSLAVAVALETLLLFWIRDDLILNVVMLVWPLDVVRAWQRGG